MSRCFPFPPPGYEEEARRVDNEELLKKEKHKEKKHKKEKRDKEKREGKERKDKDRSKDKHKERKERKEKHKDKTKDKERGKDKSRTHEDTRAEVWPEIHDADQFGYNRKAEEVKDSKFTEELGRRIRDDERGGATQSTGSFTATTQTRLEAVGFSTAVEKDSDNKMVPNLIGTAQRRNENLTHPVQKRAEGIGTGFGTTNQRATGSEKVDFVSMVPGKNHVTNRQVDNFTGPFQSRTDGTPANSLHKDKGSSNNLANSVQKERGASNSIKGHANNFTGSGQRRIEGMLTSNSIQKEIVGKSNISGQPLDSFIGSVQKSTFMANSMQKERGASNNMATNFVGAAQRKNGGMGQQAQNLSSSIHRNTEGTGLQIKDGGVSLHKERGPSTNTVSNFTGAALRQTDRIGQYMGNIMPSIQRNAGGIGLVPKMEKEAVKKSEMVSNIGSEHKTNDRLGQPEENPHEKKKEKEKSKEKKHKDRDRDEKKSKRKDKDRHKDKEKEEKTRDKSDNKKHKGQDEPKEVKKDQVDNVTKSLAPPAENVTKSLAPPAENANTIIADGNSKKRKEAEINGFLHESDERHHKLARTSDLSLQPAVENGKSLKSNHIPSPCSIKLDPVKKLNLEIVSDKKETMRNCKAEAHPSSVVSRSPVAADSGESSKASSKISRPPHPDAKYLNIVYSVPQMSELLESDDQDWLFSSKNDLKPLTKLEYDAVPPQVWAKGLQIESADVFALPYVIPY